MTDETEVWQDIATAPQGIFVLAYFKPPTAIGGSPYATCRREYGNWYCDDGEELFADPAFWSPLPPPPKEQSNER